MRRVLAACAVLFVAALIAWWALRGDDAGPGARGAGAEAAAPDESDAGDDPARSRRARDRARVAEPGADASADPADRPDDGVTEIGQDREQDPSLGAISGRVLVTLGVVPREALVEATDRGRVVARARLRDAGPFLLRNVPPGPSVALAARADGHAPGGLDRILVPAGVVTDVGTVYLGLAVDPDVDNRLDVTVTAGGKPVEGAQVTATTVFYGALLSLGSYEKQPGGTVVRATTDASGRASFERLPPASYDVLAEADGLAFEVRQRQVVQKRTRSSLTIEMSAGLTIEGRAQTEDGKPVPGARVANLRWNSFTNGPPAVTDADGKFVLRGLSPGNYLVVVAAEGVGAKEVQNVASGTKDLVVTIPAGELLWIRCTDAASGEPVREFGVRPFRKAPFAYLYAPLLEAKSGDGTFQTRLVTATDYALEVTAPGYAMASVAAVPLSPPEPFEVKLEPAGVIRGRVVEKSGGKPIRGAQVYVKRGGLPPTKVKDQTTVTDGEGLFTLDHLPRRPVGIWVSHVDHDEASFEGVEPVARAKDGSLPAPRDFPLGSGGSVEGVVLRADGAGDAGRTVQLLVGFDFLGARSATTDSEGRFEFSNVPPGTRYTVSVGEFSPGRAGRSRTNVAVAEGQVTRVEFGMDGAAQRVTGRTLRDGKPAGGVSVSLVSDDGGSFSGQERSGTDGTFAFDEVPPGRYVIRAWGTGSRTANVTVPADAPPPEVVLALATATISGRVVDAADGKPLSGVFVECDQLVEGAGGGLSELVRTNRGRFAANPDGTYTVRGLEDGTYQMRAIRDGYGTELTDAIAIAEGASRDGVDLRLGPACSVHGTVRNARGAPVDGAALQVKDSKGRRVFAVAFTQSGGDGSYAQGLLRPDVYELTFEKDGYAPASARVTLRTSEPQTVDFTLLQGGRIEVRVKRTDGAAVKDAVVTLLDAAGTAVSRGITLENIFSTGRSRTDDGGQVVLTGIAPGVYSVRALPPGSAVAVERTGVEVVDGSLTPVELVVTESR